MHSYPCCVAHLYITITHIGHYPIVGNHAGPSSHVGCGDSAHPSCDHGGPGQLHAQLLFYLSIVGAVTVTSHLEDSATSTLWQVWQHITTGAVKKCLTITTHPPSVGEV